MYIYTYIYKYSDVVLCMHVVLREEFFTASSILCAWWHCMVEKSNSKKYWWKKLKICILMHNPEVEKSNCFRKRF